MSASGLCKIEGLSIDYQDGSSVRRTLDHVSLTIPPGAVVGLVGQSGSGKSTLGLSMLGLLSANERIVSGLMHLDGQEIEMSNLGALTAMRGRVISMVFQDPLSALNPVFTIGAHLEEVLRCLKPKMPTSSKQAFIREALDTVGFPDPIRTLDQYPHELSGGMRQRIVIAMSMLAEAKIVIADEPTTALDPEVEHQVMDELISLKNRIGCAILLISHSLKLVSRLCDTVNVMLSGRIVESGPAAQVIGSPTHAYTRDLLSCEVSLSTPRQLDTRRYRFPVIRTEQEGKNL